MSAQSRATNADENAGDNVAETDSIDHASGVSSRLRVAYLGSSASPHNQRWTSYLSKPFELRVFSLESAEIDGVDVWHGDRRTGTFLDYLLALPAVARAVEEFNPDIIHAHRITSYGYLGARIARRIARAQKRRGKQDRAAGKKQRGFATPFIVSVWGEDVFSFPKRSPFHRVFTRRILKAADQILSTSHIMKEETLRYVSPDSDVYVTPFGVDTSRFVPASAANVPKNTVTVGTVKKLRARYGVDVLIRAFAEARMRLSDEFDVRCIIVGEGPQREELESLAQTLGVSESVEFVGRVPHDDVPGTLRSMDIFAALSVSDDESFGVAMIEASAMELPVVSTRIGGIPEVVRDDETGILVPPGDVSAAADAIERLVRDTELRSRLGHRGREFVRERYDWANTAARMSEIYREVYNRSAI